MKISNSFVATRPANNKTKSEVLFGSNEAKMLTDVLADINIGRGIVALKEFDLLPAVCFDRELTKYCGEIVGKLKKPLLEAEIPAKFNSDHFTLEESEKLNSLAKRPIFKVFPGDNKGDTAKDLQKSLGLDIDGVLESKDAPGSFFLHCFTNMVANIRMLQRTLGVADNYHLKNMGAIAESTLGLG